ncbi:MAG TPA: dTMP kinase, partial [Hydrogenobaculum sp.]|nr:dTMP kinase [Hydrogenobaculum sp.]
KIRDILKSQKLDPKTQTFLIEASRAHMIENHLKGFKGIVLLDRYIYSTIAYQGYGFGIDISFLKTLNDFVCDIYTPDIVFLLDIDPKTALKRLKREKDVFENLDFLERVRDGYLELAKEYSFYTIDASKNVEAITDEITAVLKQHGILS